MKNSDKALMNWLKTYVCLACLIAVTVCMCYSIVTLTDAATQVLITPEYSPYE